MPSLLRRRLNLIRKPNTGGVIDRDHPAARGLGGLWIFNDGAVIDLTQQNAPGDMNGGATFVPTPMGIAAKTDGSTTTQYVSVPDGALLNPTTGDFSFWCWALPAAVISGYTSVMIKAWESGSDQRQYGIGVTSGNRWRCVWYIAAAETSVTDASTVPSLTKPTLLVATRRASDGAITFYVNGKSTTGTATGTLQTGTSCPLVFGRLGMASPGAELFNGSVVAAGVHNALLTATDVRQLYAEPFAMIIPAMAVARAIFATSIAAVDVTTYTYQRTYRASVR